MKHTAEAKKRIGEASRARWADPKYRVKVCAKLKGKDHTVAISNLLEHGAKYRYKKGHTPSNKGVPRTDETKAKIRAKRALQPPANWKGGITPLVTRIRNSKKYAEWRTAVFERDNYTCQRCGKRGVRLEAHHILEFKEIVKGIGSYEEAIKNDKLWDIDNGITFCKNYHRRHKHGRTN